MQLHHLESSTASAHRPLKSHLSTSPSTFGRGIALAILLGSLGTSAVAQTGPGTIYYYFTHSTTSLYRIQGDGTNNTKLSALPTTLVQSTAFANYPGGRQFFNTGPALGPIPGTTASYGDIQLISEQGAVATVMTDFRGPQYVDQNGPRIRVSNDQRDSFLSFFVYDTRTASYLLCRYNGPVSDVFAPGFAPFTSDDPRLVVLTPMSIKVGIRSWDPTGTLLTYTDTNAAGQTLIYVYDASTNTSILVNDPAVSGMDLTNPWGSSTEFRLFGPATYKDGTKGMVSFYPATGVFAWVLNPDIARKALKI
jgi:hypothetical protein